jgi:polysaccharide chain length determinant protein (PEP-CTERM system associated)
MNFRNGAISMEKKTLKLKDYIDIFWRRKWFFITPVVIGVVISAVYSYSLPPTYRSSTLILVEAQKIPESYVTPTVTSSVEDRLNTISQQILSRTNLERIIKEFNLYKQNNGDSFNISNPANIIDKFKTKVSKLISYFGLYEQEQTASWNPANYVDHMRSSIEVTVLGARKSKNAFTISYSGKDPKTVMSVTNALASLFIEENLKVRERQAEGASEFLSNELVAVEKTLQDAEKMINHFKEEHNGSLPDQLDSNIRSLDRLQSELQSIDSNLRINEEKKIFYEKQILEYESIISQIYASNNTSINNRITTRDDLSSQLDDLQGKLAKLRSEFNENYPDVVIIKEQINEIQERIKAKIPEINESDIQRSNVQRSDTQQPNLSTRNIGDLKSQVQLIKSEISALKERKQKVTSLIREYEKRIGETYENEIQLISLTRDYDISKKNYEALLEKKLNAKMSENLEKRQQGEQFKILDPANIPTRPFQPNRIRISLIGSLLSGGIGAGLVLLLEYLNPCFRKPEDFYEFFDCRMLATIPSCKFSTKGRYYGITAIDYSNSIETEQYRILYTNINEFSEKHNKQIFSITSSLSGEGKTLTSLNLAVVMSRDFNKNVLLLEGNFKNPSITKYIKRELENGLVDMLLNKNNLHSTLIPFSETIIPFAHDKLSILPAVKSVNNSSSLLSSENMKELIKILKNQYDFILIDSPPILPLSDMNIFEEVVDGIVLIVRAEKTPKNALIKALEVFKTDKIIGFVLNGTTQKLLGYNNYLSEYSENNYSTK